MAKYVISDIHGCADTFNALIEKIGLNKKDKLFLLGDFIDRGPNSSGVLDTMIELQAKGYKIMPLKGNHEEHLLNAAKEYDAPTFTHYVSRICKSPDLLNKEGKLKKRYLNFLSPLPYYYLLDKYILVHAGINSSIPNPFEDINSMIVLRGFEKVKKHPMIGDRRIIHGHVPQELEKILAKIENPNQIIPIDNGCVFNKKHKIHDHTKMGNLVCLKLKKFELTIQKNIE